MNNKLIIFFLILFSFGCTQTEQPVLTEKLDRGVVVLQIDENNVYVGWRLLKDDPENIAFNVYRLRVGDTIYEKVNTEPVITTTDFIDETVRIGQAYRYRVKKIINGTEKDAPGQGYVYMSGKAERERAEATAHLLNRPYYSIKLKDEVTLMQNRQYRVGVTRSTSGYGAPPQLGMESLQ